MSAFEKICWSLSAEPTVRMHAGGRKTQQDAVLVKQVREDGILENSGGYGTDGDILGGFGKLLRGENQQIWQSGGFEKWRTIFSLKKIEYGNNKNILGAHSRMWPIFKPFFFWGGGWFLVRF